MLSSVRGETAMQHHTFAPRSGHPIGSLITTQYDQHFEQASYNQTQIKTSTHLNKHFAAEMTLVGQVRRRCSLYRVRHRQEC